MLICPISCLDNLAYDVVGLVAVMQPAQGNMTIWVGQSVDLAIPCQEGTVAIAVGDRLAPTDALRDPDSKAVRRAVERMGGPKPTKVAS